MILTYAGKSAPTARLIADEGDFQLNRGSRGDINWGRAFANTELNPDISNSTNKRVMRQLFKEYDVPTPSLLASNGMFGLAGVDKICSAFAQGKQVLGRSETHTQGRGFWLCNSMEDVKRALKGTKRKKPATHFVEFIVAPREYRVHIFDGKSIRISEKAHTGFHEYTTVKPMHEVGHVRKAAKKAVAALGLDFGAVDVLADDENCWVLEVNAAPGLGGTMPAVYAETFRRWGEGEFE